MSSNNVLITGSSSGLGNYLALYFSKKGHDVLLHGRNEDKLKETQKNIRKWIKSKIYSFRLKKQQRNRLTL